MLRIPIVIVLLAMLGGLVEFGLQNQESSIVHFATLAWSGIPQWAPVAIAGFGILLPCLLYVLIAGAHWQLRHRRLAQLLAEKRDEAERLEKENLELRERVVTQQTASS
jgi:hypothetical protein